jgi:hypothetical protein
MKIIAAGIPKYLGILLGLKIISSLYNPYFMDVI